jgi:uncharacterized membrane protein YfcA
MRQRNFLGFAGGFGIGSLGGMIGLGGAEFRLPLLVGIFKLPTLDALILNKAISLIVVTTALIARSHSIAWAELADHWSILINLLPGTLIGAWWAAGRAIRLSRQQLDSIVLILLLGLALLILGEALLGHDTTLEGALPPGPWRFAIGLLAGLGIGCVTALLGVAGGELLIPTLVLLYGLDIKLAGSLSLLISLPTMLAGFIRYREARAFAVLQHERPLFVSLSAGSVLGAIAGGLLLGWLPTQALLLLLGSVLLISALKTFQHSNSSESPHVSH